MALYPIRLLKDKNRHPFFPFNTLESVLVDGTNKNLADLLDEIYTKDEVNTMFATELSKFSVYNSVSELPATARDGAVAAVDDDETYIMYMFYDNSWHALTQKGDKGDTGSQGPAGPYFTPSVNAAGDISWTNNGGLTNPETRNIKGPQGLPGADGQDGVDGADGEDGVSPIATVTKEGEVATITITDANGTTTTTISDGEDGQDGQDGYSPTATVSKSGKVATISITDKNGTTTATVSDGEDGSGVGVWGSITGTITDQTDLQNALDGKQATLVSGTNIKTINNTSLLGSGNISISGGSGLETLTSPVDVGTLNDGLYRLPAGSMLQYYYPSWQVYLDILAGPTPTDAILGATTVTVDNENIVYIWFLQGGPIYFDEENNPISGEPAFTYFYYNKTLNRLSGNVYDFDFTSISARINDALLISDVIDNLTTNASDKALSAKQGRHLNLNKKGVDVVINVDNKNNAAIISAIDAAYQKFKTGKTADSDIYFYINYQNVDQLFIANFYKLTSSTTQISLVTPYFFQTNLTQNTNETPGYQYRLKCNITNGHITSTEGFYVQNLNLLDGGTGPLLRKSSIEALINTAIGGALGGNY